jgi:uncharacterized Tic20 family protein
MSVAMPALDEQTPNWTQPNAPPDNGQVWSKGRLRDDRLTEVERNFSIATHLSPFSAIVIGPLAFFAPLVLWLIRKDHSAFNDDHGREICNFMISIVLLTVISGITIIGLLFWPVLVVVAIVSPIRAAIAAGKGEYFRYPMTFRFL